MNFRALSYLIVSLAGICSSEAAAPIWFPGPLATHQVFGFTNSQNPSPLTLDQNPYGNPTAVIQLGPFADGWQDPAVPSDLIGPSGNPDGAWELGQSGTMIATIPIAPITGSYDVQFQISVVWYDGLTKRPVFSVAGYPGASISSSTSLVEVDPIIGSASWQETIWTGTIFGATSNQIGMTLTAPGSGSYVANYEIYTNVIPEPTTFLLGGGFAIAAMLRRRRM